jgi:hypothetical protein
MDLGGQGGGDRIGPAQKIAERRNGFTRLPEGKQRVGGDQVRMKAGVGLGCKPVVTGPETLEFPA